MIDRQISLGIVHCFGGGSAPAVQPAPDPPAKNDAAVQASMEKERALARLRRGRSSTILTSGLGLEDPGTKKTLLGA